MLLWKLTAALVAIAGGWGLSAKVIGSLVSGNRNVEWDKNEKSEPLSIQQLQWQVVHIRDDIGSLCGLICLTNGLLAGILVAIIL